ncbi:sulfotransferase domain-containing protein [Marivita sp.]|uniref:sulfotransferase domain-containing protein n=1 Tax=Marivita sp. TaxID=2003365 RepID=UPI0025C4BEE2|nr:sulfotransferase domain-containing protein [Marivita sp.]
MTLPNYIYGGPPKAGSSWIYDLLDRHPEVFVPEGKYVQFFTDYYDRGIEWYERLYSKAQAQHVARVDLTTDYLFLPEPADRLAQHIPDAKVFFSLRNPVDRDWSAYQHLLRTGQSTGALKDELMFAHHLLTKCSAYSDAIERSWRLFGRENTLILWFDDIRSEPQKAADMLHDFLGVSRRQISTDDSNAKNIARAARNPRLNGLLKRGAITMRAAGMSGALSKLKNNPLMDRLLFSPSRVPKLYDTPEDWTILADRHAGEIARLETLLDRDLSDWRRRP